jgi:hypothetical protein
MDSTLTFDVNTVRKAYLVFIPLGLFWATYKAWKEENDGRLKAEQASPEVLRNEIAALKADLESQKHRTLSAKQRSDLEAAIRDTLKDNEYLGFSSYYNWLDPEAEQYARQFAAVFVPLSVSGVPGPTQDVPPDLEGLVIGVKDARTIPRNAQRLSDALTKANITHRFGTVTGHRNSLLKDDHVELLVGRRSRET